MKTILWDFDGVILDSMKIRTEGFLAIFSKFEKSKINQLINYHLENGGLSRYIKIKYFFEEIQLESIDQKTILSYADKFSIIMREKLTDKNNLIKDTVEFIKFNHESYKFHIVSGSDQEELQYLCKELGITEYFESIHGSPTPKTELVANVIRLNTYVKNKVCLIGDSINDYNAAKENNISFYGYNNPSLKHCDGMYINNFLNFNF